MAIDTTRAAVETIKQIITSQGFTLAGYTIEPDKVTLTVTAPVKDLPETEITLKENNIKKILEIYGWPVIGAQTANNHLIVSAERRRTIAGIS